MLQTLSIEIQLGATASNAGASWQAPTAGQPPNCMHATATSRARSHRAHLAIDPVREQKADAASDCRMPAQELSTALACARGEARKGGRALTLRASPLLLLAAHASRAPPSMRIELVTFESLFIDSQTELGAIAAA